MDVHLISTRIIPWVSTESGATLHRSPVSIADLDFIIQEWDTQMESQSDEILAQLIGWVGFYYCF